MKKQGFDIERWQNEHSINVSSCRQLLLDEIEKQLDGANGDDFLEFDIDGISQKYSRIRMPLKTMRDRVVPNVTGQKGDRSVYYPRRRLFVAMVKSDPKVRRSPVHYFCRRLESCPGGATIIEEDKHESRMDLHRETARFIIGMIDREGFNADDLRKHLGLGDNKVDGIRRANQELSYFTDKMDIEEVAPEGWIRWCFRHGEDDLYLQQAISTDSKRNASSRPIDLSRGGKSLPSHWMVINCTGREIKFDTGANAALA